MFFGAHHGKGRADGVVGRMKGAAKRAVKACRAVIRNAWEFAQFCKEVFKQNKFDSLMNQPFNQEIFYVTDIEKDEEIKAVTASNTESFYSIRSTGNLLIIEAREVSYCCDSCMENGGKECPNQAYASLWQAINLKTGKTLLSDDFVHTHWTPEGQATPISKICDVSDGSDEIHVFNAEYDTDGINPEERSTNIDWNQNLMEMESW